jgi:hypothetical protein
MDCQQETNVCETVVRYDLAIKVSEQSCFKNAVMKVGGLQFCMIPLSIELKLLCTELLVSSK